MWIPMRSAGVVPLPRIAPIDRRQIRNNDYLPCVRYVSRVADATELLTYQVTISQPDSVSQVWWQVGNAGTPPQVAAALSELALRCARELTDAPPAVRHWYLCEVRGPDDVQLDYFVGAVCAIDLPGQLEDVARRIIEITSAGSWDPDTGSRVWPGGGSC